MQADAEPVRRDEQSSHSAVCWSKLAASRFSRPFVARHCAIRCSNESEKQRLLTTRIGPTLPASSANLNRQRLQRRHHHHHHHYHFLSSLVFLIRHVFLLATYRLPDSDSVHNSASFTPCGWCAIQNVFQIESCKDVANCAGSVFRRRKQFVQSAVKCARVSSHHQIKVSPNWCLNSNHHLVQRL